MHPKHRVLVIEDDPLLLSTVNTFLTRRGYAVDEARDSVEAVACLKKNLPCLIFLDILLPGKSGLEFLAKIRACEEIPAIPVFILTQFPEERFMKEAHDLRVQEYFVKAKHTLQEIAERTERQLYACRGLQAAKKRRVKRP